VTLMPYKPRVVVLVSKSFEHAARQIVFPEKIDAAEDRERVPLRWRS